MLVIEHMYVLCISNSTETRQAPYLQVSWIGSNNKLILQTLKLYPHEQLPNIHFLEMLCDTTEPGSKLISDTHHKISGAGAESLIESARHCANKRFLLILDYYQGDCEDMELMLNRAVPFDDES